MKVVLKLGLSPLHIIIYREVAQNKMTAAARRSYLSIVSTIRKGTNNQISVSLVHSPTIFFFFK